MAATMTTVASSASVAPGNGQATNPASGGNYNEINNRWASTALQQPQMQLDSIGSGNGNSGRVFNHLQPSNYNLSQSSNANTMQLHQPTSTTGTGTGWSDQLRQWFTSTPKLDILLIALATAALLWVVIVFVGARLFGNGRRLNYSARLPIKMRFQLNSQSPAAMLSSNSTSKSNQRRRISSSLKSSSWRSNDTSNSNNTSPSGADLIIGTRTMGTGGAMLFHQPGSAGYTTRNNNGNSGKGHPSANNNYYANTTTLAAAAATNNGLIHFGTGPLIGANGCDSQGGDSSEHDMLQSACSSSNYDEFVQQQQLLMQHQQPIYLQNSNSMATLANNNSNNNNNGGTGGAISNYHRSSSSRHQQPPMLKATTTTGRPCRQQGTAIYGHNTLMCVGASNLASNHSNNNTTVPLIDGTQNSSHIQIDHQGTYRRSSGGRHSHNAAHLPGQHQQQQQLMPLLMNSTQLNSNNNNEHIYDDIVYNRMVL